MITAKRFSAVVAVLLLSVLSCITVFDQEPREGTEVTDPIIPYLTETTGWWYDTTSRVPEETIQELDALSDAAEQDGWQIGGVIWNNSVSEPSQICTDFGNENGIGDSETDNGLAICIFLDREGSDGHTPYIFVAVGKGLEGQLPDSRVGWFLDTYAFPQRAEGNWEQGVIDMVGALHGFLADPDNPEYETDSASSAVIILLIIIGLIFLLILLSIILTGDDFLDGMAYSAGTGGGGWGGGFSGGLGGGGGFGGGGAGG